MEPRPPGADNSELSNLSGLACVDVHANTLRSWSTPTDRGAASAAPDNANAAANAAPNVFTIMLTVALRFRKETDRRARAKSNAPARGSPKSELEVDLQRVGVLARARNRVRAVHQLRNLRDEADELRRAGAGSTRAGGAVRRREAVRAVRLARAGAGIHVVVPVDLVADRLPGRAPHVAVEA